jgi:hypothetical protein
MATCDNAAAGEIKNIATNNNGIFIATSNRAVILIAGAIFSGAFRMPRYSCFPLRYHHFKPSFYTPIIGRQWSRPSASIASKFRGATLLD